MHLTTYDSLPTTIRILSHLAFRIFQGWNNTAVETGIVLNPLQKSVSHFWLLLSRLGSLLGTLWRWTRKPRKLVGNKRSTQPHQRAARVQGGTPCSAGMARAQTGDMNKGKALGSSSRAIHNKDKDVEKVMTFSLLCLLKTAQELSWNYPKPLQLVAHVGQVHSEPKLLSFLVL